MAFKKRSKYGNKKAKCDGYTFDSIKEYGYYVALKYRAAKGEITDLVVHPKFPILINGIKVFTYIADFGYTENGTRIIVDVKSDVTRKIAVYRLKKKCVEAYYKIIITEI